jgi:hypothetical protein
MQSSVGNQRTVHVELKKTAPHACSNHTLTPGRCQQASLQLHASGTKHHWPPSDAGDSASHNPQSAKTQSPNENATKSALIGVGESKLTAVNFSGWLARFGCGCGPCCCCWPALRRLHCECLYVSAVVFVGPPLRWLTVAQGLHIVERATEHSQHETGGCRNPRPW